MRFPMRALLLLGGLFAAGQALAQAEPAHTRLYRLEPRSTFQRGCFDPCLCPIMDTAPLRGTFRLAPAGVGNVFDFYDVASVRWTARLASSAVLPITGLGTYKVSPVARLQQMELDLAVDGAAAERFDSGEVAIPVGFPRIDVTISIHGVYCFDTVMELHARPTMRLHAYRDDLSWDDEPAEAAPWDVVYGDLGALRASGGDFATSTTACLARSYWDTTLAWADDPAPGQGFWFLARRDDDTFSDGAPEQVGDPDAGIASSGAGCR